MKQTSESWWVAYLKDAPEQTRRDLMRYYANQRLNWNKKKLGLTKLQLAALCAFQKAISLGVDEETFRSMADGEGVKI